MSRLEAKGLSVGYGRDQVVFPDISFSAQPGDMVALLGVNGIGKSTLLRTISGLQQSVKGEVILKGQSLHSISVQERAKLISIVLTERIQIDHITVNDFIALGRMPYTGWLGKLSEEDAAQAKSVISVMKLTSLQHKLFNEISDGEKQKVLIARALCQQTPVIILDEPTAFLDFRNKKVILELLSGIARDLNKTIVLSTHDIEASLEYCNKCWLMTEDRKFREIIRNANYRNEVFSVLMQEASHS